MLLIQIYGEYIELNTKDILKDEYLFQPTVIHTLPSFSLTIIQC